MRRRVSASREDSIEREESLVPFIEEQERLIEERLEAARSRAADSVRAAEVGAKERAAAALQRVPQLQEERRSAALAEIEQESEGLERELSARTRSLRASLDGRIREAAGVVVDLVWPHSR